MNRYLRELYLDWFNNWLTVTAFAEHHGIHQKDAIELIEMGRKYHELHVEALQANVEDFA